MAKDLRGLAALARAARAMQRDRLHPQDAGPAYRDAAGQRPQLVQCPDCHNLEWWIEQELTDHGRCRTYYLATTCACDD